MHVDYSSEMHTPLNKKFHDANNVLFLVQLQEDSSSILVADRLGYLNQTARAYSKYSQQLDGIGFTQYDDLKGLMHDIATIKTRNKREREKQINGLRNASTKQDE